MGMSECRNTSCAMASGAERQRRSPHVSVKVFLLVGVLAQCVVAAGPAGKSNRERALAEDETAGAWVRRKRQSRAENTFTGQSLVPYLQYGPNNQYLQLMEAAVVARSLDRTLMVPGFQAWVNDETGSKDSFVSFEETFDMQAVQQYVPIVPISRLQHSAAWKDQRVLTTSDYKKARMADYLEHQGLECCPRKSFRKVGGLTSAREIQKIVADEGLSSIQQLGWYSFFSLSRELTLEAARHFVRAPHIRRNAFSLFTCVARRPTSVARAARRRCSARVLAPSGL